ncbi:hypothetical protein M0R04_12230 [Candidatus Dojkabacteria bacterium]|jgi:hypothetical protein|nr:hypothetical protein [Candidatus Dojkabacteria bacterium]
MTSKELETILKEFNEDLEVYHYCGQKKYEQKHGGVDAIFYKGESVCAIPPVLYRHKDPRHTDWSGTPHRSLIDTAKFLREQHLITFQQHKDLINSY